MGERPRQRLIPPGAEAAPDSVITDRHQDR